MPKILLVEDDNNLREIFEMRLQAEGYKTVTAGDGEEALAVAMKEKPDLIIADVMMPKLSGFEMVENLRSAPEMSKVKVIMMTALGQAEDRARGERLGVVKYLVKSQVTLEDFVRVVREVMPPDEPASQANNKKESENSMPEDNQTPTNPTPTPPADGATPGVNPISGAPSADASSAGAMSTAQEQSSVQNQINDFASGTPATPGGDTPVAGGDSSAAAPAGDSSAPVQADVPVATPPSDDTSAGGSSDQPAAPGAAPGGDSTPGSTPPPAV